MSQRVSKRLCSFAGCGRRIHGHDYCVSHLWQIQHSGKLTPIMPPPTVAERFWSRVTKGDGCWLFESVAAKFGYRRFRGFGQTLAHRVSWILHFGPIPSIVEHPGTLLVCHRCDNPPCVNPAHLFLGTIQDNTADMMRKGRQWRGSR